MRPQSIRAKFFAGMLALIVFLLGGVALIVEYRQRVAIIEEMERRGEVLARNLAAASSGYLLLYHFTALEQTVTRAAGEDDVVYAIVLDATGRVAAHSRRPDRAGLLLEGAVDERAAGAVGPLTQQAVWPETGELVYDFTTPVVVEGRKWGAVRIGLSRQRMERAIATTRHELLLLAAASLLLGGLVAALLARRIARPVQQLAEGVAAISRGELVQRIEPGTADEIGRLAAAFNHMAVELLQQRTALEEAHNELRRQFEELTDLKGYTDNILACLTSGIVTVDLEGRVVTLNPAAELLTGYFRGEAAGRYCTELFVHTPELSDVLMETLTSRVPVTGIALTLRRRNGSVVPIEFSTAPLRGSEGKELGVIGVFRDLTPVRRLEERLRRSDRLAALGTLAAGLAHEIKNPLTSLLTFTRHLSRRFDDESFRQRFQRVVPRELERINGIVERLLELARPASLRFERVRVPVLLDRVTDLYANEIDTAGVVVVREYARDLPAIQADGDALYRVLVNVVANALDAMPAGGRLSLRAGWHEGREALPRARWRGAGRRIRIEIEDTGAGIPLAERERVFNPFFTTKDGGTGLGLALSHKIVEDHGGSIDFTSLRGGGTTFTIVLPLVPEPPGEAGLESATD